jgi:Ca-activated chloride channel homolog
MRTTRLARALAALALLPLSLLTACASGSSEDSAAPAAAQEGSGQSGAVGVGQSGAQDFGLFRQILDRGQIPGPETLDDLGFFAEHKLDFPAPTCGDDVCLHASVGVVGNMITGSTCTLLELGMNTPINPEELARPALDLVVVVDTSGSMSGGPIGSVRAGLTRMLDALEPGDRVSLVSFSDKATVVIDGAAAAADRAALEAAFAHLSAGGATNLYDGLFTGLALARSHKEAAAAGALAAQNRVVFLSDGEATAGIESGAKLRSLAEGFARQGISISSIGVGTAFDVKVMRGLGEVGAGNFYFLEDARAVEQVFTDEVRTFLYPLALDAHIDVSVATPYAIRGVYGTRGWEGGVGAGSIDLPALFIARRESAEAPVEGGRRGGGGAMLLELIPISSQVGTSGDVGTIAFSWKRPTTGEVVHQTLPVSTPFATNAGPAQGYFSEETSEKAFVMLNIFAALRLASQHAADADPRAGRGVLEALAPNVATWLAAHPDPDVEDDLRYVRIFITNLKKAEQSASVNTLPAPIPENPWPKE